MRAAERAIGIFLELELAKLHAESVEEHEASDKRITRTENQFDCFDGLQRANNSGQHAEDATLSAGRDESRRGRLWIQATVAGTIGRTENTDLAFKAENGTVDVAFAEEDA